MEGKNKEVKATSIYERYIKRLLDFTSAIFLLIVLFPFMILLHIIIKLEDIRTPAIFKQTRCGRNNKPFVVYKFRSMKASAPKNLATREFDDSDKYISKLGKFIRKTSLDELPQLINIIKGEMSFVGPRPVILEERDLIEAREMLGANKVLPGITGNAQTHGRDEVGIIKKAEYDANYCKNITLVNDLKLFFMTIPVVNSRKGNKDEASVESSAIVEVFEAREQEEKVPGLDFDVVNR